MGYFITEDDFEPLPLASTTGMGDLHRWVESIPVEACPNLSHLLEHGWTEDAQLAKEELEKAIAKFQPDGETKKTADSMLDAISDSASVLTIGDGLGDNDVVADS